MNNIYIDNKYWHENSDYHERDAKYKAINSLSLLSKINLTKNSKILDLGCGSGKYLYVLSNYMDGNFYGVDISSKSIERANKLFKKENLKFENKNLDQLKNAKFDLIILNDVFEHVEDYIKFLKEIKLRSKYFYFNIPLEINFMSIIRGNFTKSYNDVGHLHYFTKDSALQILKHANYVILDWKYFFYSKHELKKHKTIKLFIMYLIISLFKLINKDFTVKIFGSASLGVICE